MTILTIHQRYRRTDDIL